MITIALIVAAAAPALFIAPAVCLQLFVSRCYSSQTQLSEPESDAAPLSQRLTNLLNADVTPETQPLSA
jgi:hypothetical protein